MTQTNIEDGPAQDLVYGLAVSPNFAEDGVCFAARQSGLYRSHDGGQSWEFAYSALNLQVTLPTFTVAISPNFQKDQRVFAGVSGGVLRSLDGGQQWEPVYLPEPPPHVLSLEISPNFANDSIILAGTLEDGIFRSADQGYRWMAWNFGLLDFNLLCLAISPTFATDNTLFAGVESGIFYSKNGGLAWREVDFSPELAPVLSLALSPHYADDGIVLAGTEQQGLYRSDDRGRHWVRLAEDVITGAVNTIILAPEFPAHPELLILQDNQLLSSADGGQSWTDRTINLAANSSIGAIAAPQGLAQTAPLLIGQNNGPVLRV